MYTRGSPYSHDSHTLFESNGAPPPGQNRNPGGTLPGPWEKVFASLRHYLKTCTGHRPPTPRSHGRGRRGQRHPSSQEQNRCSGCGRSTHPGCETARSPVAPACLWPFPWSPVHDGSAPPWVSVLPRGLTLPAIVGTPRLPNTAHAYTSPLPRPRPLPAGGGKRFVVATGFPAPSPLAQNKGTAKTHTSPASTAPAAKRPRWKNPASARAATRPRNFQAAKKRRTRPNQTTTQLKGNQKPTFTSVNP